MFPSKKWCLRKDAAYVQRWRCRAAGDYPPSRTTLAGRRPGPGSASRPGFSEASGGRRSHYSYNEIIMTAAQRPHHRNIYCIIYSAVPWFRGENTYKLRLLSSPPHSLPFAAQSRARSLSSFHSSFSSLLVCSSQMRRGEHLSGPGAAAAWPASGGRIVLVLAFIFSLDQLLFCCCFTHG